MTELESLKEIATNKGISFPQNITVAKLKDKIKAFDEGTEGQEEAESQKATMTRQARANKQRKEQEKLIRVIVTCMDPNKSKWRGQFFTVGNALIPHQTKYIQFGNPYHISKFMYDEIKQTKYRTSREISDGKGGKVRENLIHSAFAIEVLDDLTEKELADLRTEQAARGTDQ